MDSKKENKKGKHSWGDKYKAKKWWKKKVHSKHKGVTFKMQGTRAAKWISQICIDRKQIYLGCFPFNKKGELEAALAYRTALKNHKQNNKK